MFTVVILAVCLFSACSAAPTAEPSVYDPCVIERCHTIPIHSTVTIKTTHRIIPINTCPPYAKLPADLPVGLGVAGLGNLSYGYKDGVAVDNCGPCY